LQGLADLAVNLWKRRVVQFGVVYLGVAWLVLQVAAQLEETFALPEWVDQTAVIVLAVGFPVVLIVAWLFERSAQGSELLLSTNDAESEVSGGAEVAALAKDTDSSRPPAEPLLAVLPFDNLSSDEEMQFFSDGVSEEIMGRLTRGSNLRVLGRASSFQFRGLEKPKAGSALNASHVLDGSIRRAANRVRVAAHLVETDSQTTLWSERYEKGLQDIFAVQDEIAESIAQALHQTLDRSSAKSIDPALYDLYLRASPRTYAPDDLRMRVELLEPVTQQAPDFAAAWGRLAYVRSCLRLYEPYASRAESGTQVLKESDRALVLDPQNLDALSARYYVVQAFGRFEAADNIVDQIIRAPGMAEPKFSGGFHLACVGRGKAAAELNRRLHENDPLNLILALRYAASLLTIGRYQNAISILNELLAREPRIGLAQTTLVRAHAFNKDWVAVDKMMEPENPLPWFDSAEFVRTQRHPSAEKTEAWRRGLRDYYARTGCADASRLVQAAHLGLVEDAYDIAETARFGPPGTDEDITDPDAYRTAILFHAGMPELRNDRRFAKLCARLGLVEFWRATDKWPDCADQVPYDFKAECKRARDIPKQTGIFALAGA
jgi:TolB-like protein